MKLHLHSPLHKSAAAKTTTTNASPFSKARQKSTTAPHFSSLTTPTKTYVIVTFLILLLHHFSYTSAAGAGAVSLSTQHSHVLACNGNVIEKSSIGNRSNVLDKGRKRSTASAAAMSKRRRKSSWEHINRGGACFLNRGGGGNEATMEKKTLTSPTLRRRLVLLLVASALFNDTLQLTMLLPIIPALLSSPPPLGVESNAEIAMGIFFASKDIFQLTTAPLAGMLTARTSSTVALLSSTIGLGLATLVFADATSFKELLLARSCQGAASAATLCGGLSLVSETFPAEVRGSAMGTAYTGLALGLLCGPLVGGLLYEAYGRRTTFRIAATGVLLNAAAQIALIMLVPPPPPPEDKSATKIKEEKETSEPGLKESLGVLISNRNVRTLALSTAVIHGSLGVLKPLSQVVLQREFNMNSASKRSFVISIATLAYLIITPIAGYASDRMSKSTLITTSLVLMTCSTAFFSLRHLGLWAVNICVGLAGSSLAFAMSVTQALMADLVDRDKLGGYGMAFALSDMSDSLGLIVGPIVGLAASQYFGPSVGLGIMGLACLALAPGVKRIPS